MSQVCIWVTDGSLRTGAIRPMPPTGCVCVYVCVCVGGGGGGGDTACIVIRVLELLLVFIQV